MKVIKYDSWSDMMVSNWTPFVVNIFSLQEIFLSNVDKGFYN